MKKSFKLIALLLALVMSVSLFAACDKGDKNDTDDNAANETSAPSDEYFPDVAKNNYDTDFFISNQTDCNNMKYHWVEESDGDAMSEAIYLRQEQVRKYLGVEITATEAGKHDVYHVDFQTAVKNKDNSVHLLMSHVHSGIESLISGGYLADFNDFDSLNLDADYWNYQFMEDLAIEDMMFLGNSNFNILYTYVIAFNKTMLNQQYDGAVKAGIFEDGETIYDVVTNYRWTLDKMISLASLVSVDKTGNGKSDDDTFGLTGVQWVPYIGFLQACNVQLVDVAQDGSYKVSFYNELNKAKSTDIVVKLSELSKADYAWFRYRIEDTPEIHLQSNRTLMELKSTNYLPGLCDYDVEFGIIPYPMYDEAQASVGYRHLQWGGYLCIPSYLENPNMVGDTLEMLAYYSANVNTTFYEKLLGKQVADVPEDKAMLELVWGSVVSDFGQTYSTVCGGLYMIPELTHAAEPNIASYHDGMERSANKAIKKFIATTASKYGK